MTDQISDEQRIEQECREKEWVEFHEWWKKSGHADSAEFDLTAENACHAAWQACAELRALRTRESEAVPVAWRFRERPGFDWRLTDGDPDRDLRLQGHEKQPLFTHPTISAERVTDEIERRGIEYAEANAIEIDPEEVRELILAALTEGK